MDKINHKRVAIVILNWNGRAMLEQYLPSVCNALHPSAAVYVADNASTDDSLTFLKSHFPEVGIIPMSRNRGFAGGYNEALRQVDAEYYVLLNSDVETPVGWLTPLLRYMDDHAEVAACQPKLLSWLQKDTFEYAGACGGYLDRLGYPYCRGRVFDVVEHDAGQYDAIADVLWATGACLFIRSADYWAVGGLDERFFAHNEEIDLCWRLRLLGRRIVCIPESRVYHLGGGTLPKGNPQKTFLNFRNNLTMIYKCTVDDRELRRVMRWRWFLDYLAALQALVLCGHFGDFRAILRARRAFRKWRGDFSADRERIQQTAVVGRVGEQKRFSLLWQYYVRRRKTYASLPE